jgi:Antirestriction protein (ArdA)
MEHRSSERSREEDDPGNSGNERAIQLGIEAARAEDREVDDAVARAIAAQLHGGQHSALYTFVSTGNLDDERLEAELRAVPESQERVVERASVLGTYALHREHRDPVDGWAALWPGTPTPSGTEPADDEAEARGVLMGRISAAGLTTLGQVATISAADGVYGLGVNEHEPVEVDDVPWADAARWRPDLDDEDDDERVGPNIATIETLFNEPITETFGSRGRHRLVRLDAARRATRRCRSAGESVRAAHGPDHRLRRGAGGSLVRPPARTWGVPTGAGSAETYHGDAPEIWVGSLADYVAGYLHGVWLDAALTPDELAPAIQFVLRNSHEPDAEEYAVFDDSGFGSELTGLLGE